MSRPISRWRLTAGAGILLLAAVVSLWMSWSRRAPDKPLHEYGLNVLLITVDTLRADAIGAYGQTAAATPWMDRLALAGARFTFAHAHNVVTLPSHANILSGRLPTDHGVRDNAGFRFPARLETLATLLKAQGYRTGAFVSAFPLAARFGLARGFDEYDDRFSDAARPAFLIQERSGRDTIGRARTWLAGQRDARWFCWVHIYEPHFPYAPPEPFASRFPDNPYNGEVAAADAALGPLLQPILDAGVNGRTLVVLTADHGEALGDHGEATHGVFAYEATLRVPLVIYQPRLFAATTIAAPVQHVDVMPTILDALALQVPQGLPGQSLLPLLDGERAGSDMAGRATYFEALSSAFNRGWAPLAGVLQDRSKYIDLPIPELYELTADPAERRNLARDQPGRSDVLRAALDAFRTASAATPQPETAETRERLRSLGYLAVTSRPAARFTEADDPKQLIALDKYLQDIVTLYDDGKLDAAAARCRELIQRRPGMPVSYVYLAHIERERGRLGEAVEALRRAVALAPDNAEAVALYGGYLTQAGRAVEAAAMLDQYEKRHGDDVEVLTTHALAHATAGRTRDALAILHRVRELDPSNAMLAVNAGTVHLMAGDRDTARREFEAALRANPDAPRAHSSLGILDLEDRRIADAVAHWRAATARDAREFQTILGAALALRRAGRTAEARAALEFFVANAPSNRYAVDIEQARALLATLQ